jgi:hypothetical protein
MAFDLKTNLLGVLDEICDQKEVGKLFPKDGLSFSEHIEQLREWILSVGEYGIAYESLVVILEKYPFRVSGRAAVQLLEVGLYLQYKTDRDEDAEFNIQQY